MIGRLKIVFVGWGAINSRVGELLNARGTPVDILGIATLDTPAARSALPSGVAFLSRPEELAALKPDIVIEAAGRAAIDQWAPSALEVSRSFIMASTSALIDDLLLERLVSIAERTGCRIQIPSGAIGAIDALAGASLLSLDEVTHQIIKPPKAWRGTVAEQLFDLSSLAHRQIIFEGSAREAARTYPQNANATVVTALAGVGLNKTKVELIADPAIAINEHRIKAAGDFGSFDITFKNRALATNPKSSELSALSLVRLIENHTKTLVI